MEQRRLYKTLESAFKHFPSFESDKQLLSYVLKEVISHENIDITGGRIWDLNDNKIAYVMVEQHGEIEKIRKGYALKLNDYPIFYEVGRNRSILAQETDKYLTQVGIHLYSATGIGERYKVKDKNGADQYLYQYILAFNSNEMNVNLLNTMNIISTSVSSMLRTRGIEKKASAIEKDLVKAREIQKSILPEHEYSFSNYEIFGISIPDRIVGGDFFDYLTFGTEKDKLGIAIGDAASKGFSAAAQALYVSGALKMGTENELKMTAVMKKINNLVHKVFPYERFLTLFYMEIYNDIKGLCLYVNAGHNPPIHLSYSTNNMETLNATGPVLGPAPEQDYNTDSFYFDKNDLMVLYTDGIVEATNNKFEFFGEDRLKEVILNNKNFSPKEIAENIIEAVQKFSAKAKYSDDKTVVVIKRVS
ncbi:MAG: serine/threonine-protein phosphatase [Chlorobi bacterium]|nr:serine/threonine-protein phosphatase [Chlorobiota bacterium]MCI0717223.1 serine/threonine-protein phosphatase [Chlorobiota bacterium]